VALHYAIPTALEFFASLVHSDPEFALFEAAVSLAQDEYPETDVQAALDEMDQLLARVRRRIPADAAPLQRLQILNRFFYGDLGFSANPNNYYDPDNSYPGIVLHSRRGIPISLAVLWLELAHGLGLDAHGVSFPGHFLLKIDLPMGQAILEPLTGQSLSREALSEMLEPYRRRTGLADGEEVPLGLYLQAASPREILARMLRNLKEIFRAQDDWTRVLAVQERLVVLLPKSWAEVRDRGMAHLALDQRVQALRDLETYLLYAEQVVDADAVASQAAKLRRSLRA
jgi:regulator of sirC expression with transglutaminase-like and TPR domain